MDARPLEFARDHLAGIDAAREGLGLLVDEIGRIRGEVCRLPTRGRPSGIRGPGEGSGRGRALASGTEFDRGDEPARELREETGEIEIKYLLGRSYWGRGIATEAAGVCIEYAFLDAQLDTIIGLTHPENIASQRVLEKIGLNFRNKAEYFGMNCYRFTMTKDQFDSNQR